MDHSDRAYESHGNIGAAPNNVDPPCSGPQQSYLPPSDLTLAAEAQLVAAGDELPRQPRADASDHFEALMVKYLPMIWAEARRWVRNPDEPADFVQETCLLAWRKRRSFRGGRMTGDGPAELERSFVVWLRRLSRTVGRGASRRNRREAQIIDPSSIAWPSQSDPGSTTSVASVSDCEPAEDEDSDALISRLLVLPPQQLAVVVYRLWIGYSTNVTAEILGCRPGTVKAALFQAKRALRRRAYAPTKPMVRSRLSLGCWDQTATP